MKYNGRNLEEVIEAHRKWLSKKKGINSDYRADFSGTNLQGMSFTNVNLSGANFESANLYLTKFHNVTLNNANMSKALMAFAYFNKCRLRKVDFSYALLPRVTFMDHCDISYADFSHTELNYSYFANTNCLKTKFTYSSLCYIHFYDCDLIGTDFDHSCLKDLSLESTTLKDAINIPYIPMACPETGGFIGWKTCNSDYGRVIVKLYIPENARRSSGTGRKCRADMAEVLEIQALDGTPLNNVIARSFQNYSFYYIKGTVVTPAKDFCEDRYEECSSGIHFFLNREEAVNYL